MKELGNPKGKKPKEIPAHFEVCEPCKVHLDNGEDIPIPLLARLLKFKLLSIKTNDQKRREAEKKVKVMCSICYSMMHGMPPSVAQIFQYITLHESEITIKDGKIWHGSFAYSLHAIKLICFYNPM